MAPRVEPVTSNEAAPSRADVVIVGGGIIGASTALFLARKGVSIVLCEKGHIAGEQSSRNWGWCRKMGRDPRELPLIIESLRLWSGMDQMVEGDTGFRRTGILYLCENEKDLAKRQAWLQYANLHQLDSRMVTGDEAGRLLGGSARRWAGALYTASDGRAEPQKAAPAIARAAQRLGATVLGGCAVRGIETQAGRVAAVVTEKGRIACAAVVLCGGAWSGLFCRSLGLTLPQLKVLASVMRTAPIEGGPEAAAWGPGFAFRRRQDGGYTVAHGSANVAEIVPDSFRFFFFFFSRPALPPRLRRVGRGGRAWALDEVSPFERLRVLDPEPVAADLEAARRNVEAAFPVFRGAAIAERWAGLIDATPDTVPVISPVDKLPGFFIATGFSGHGFGIGPGAGRLAADLVAGDPPVVGPSPFRFSRFTDGSPPRPMAGV